MLASEEGESCLRSSSVGTRQWSRPRSDSSISRSPRSSSVGLPETKPHTQRAYRQDVIFVKFLGIGWPEESTHLFTVSVADVLGFRDLMVEEDKAPKTINRRIASLSSFYKYLQGVASEFRLPITVPNPAHAQFIPRGSSDPREETKALSATEPGS